MSENKTYRRIYTIPDVHGRNDLLQKALRLMGDDGYDPTTDLIVFTGDYIDRGPDSKGVLDTVRRLVDAGHAVALRGNHEDFAVDMYVKNKPHAMDAWVWNGMWETLDSYGGNMSDEHIKFLGGLPYTFECQGFFFSHAPVPRERSRTGRKTYDTVYGSKGTPYNVWELTWHYFGPDYERKGAYMDVHEGPIGEKGEHLIGLCGHIHRGSAVQEIRVFKNYRMLDCGCGCYPNSPLAVHECIENRTLYAFPDKS